MASSIAGGSASRISSIRFRSAGRNGWKQPSKSLARLVVPMIWATGIVSIPSNTGAPRRSRRWIRPSSSIGPQSAWATPGSRMVEGCHGSPLGLLQHRQDVAGRILEPRDRRAIAARDAALVLPGFLAVVLECHACREQLVDGSLDVVDREVEGRVGRRLVIVLRVDQHPSAA